MLTKDGFDPDQPLPSFLVVRAERPGLGKPPHRAVPRSRILVASLLIAAATALAIAAFSTGNPVTSFAELTAALDRLGRQPGTDQPAPAIQAATEAPALPPAAKNELTASDIAAAEPAGQDQAKISDPQAEALFRQFQAWAAGKDAQAQVAPAQSAQDAAKPVQDAAAQPVEDSPAQLAQDAPTQIAAPAPIAQEDREPQRLTQRQRHAQRAREARAEMLRQNSRKMERRAQNALPPSRAVGARD